MKISREEFESLNIVKPAKNNTFWPVAGFAVLLTTLTRKYIEYPFRKRISYINMLHDTSRCFRIVLYIITKLKLHIFDKNKSNNEKIILIPTFKIFVYLYLLIYYLVDCQQWL